MASIKSTRSLTLDIPPSCIEFVPGHPELFVVGTYYLERKDEEGHDTTESTTGQPQQRTGSLLLFKLEGDEVTLQHTLPTPFAIFDIHFAPASPTSSSPSAPVLGAATSTGSLALYEISASSLSITPLSVLQIFPTTSLITFFAWHPTIPSLAALALSSSSIYLCDTATIAAAITTTTSSAPVLEDGDTTPTAAYLHAHALEAWFVAFTPDGRSLLTGGDDSTLVSLAPLPHASSAQELLAAIADADAPPAVQWQDRKTHQAGVTAILPLPLALSSSSDGEEGSSQQPVLCLTGSYDDHIRLLALPTPTSFPRRPKLLAELDLGGGVWRLKDITAGTEREETGSGGYEYTILASCMHAGARVLRLKGSSQDEGGEEELEWSFDVLAAFEEHKSMNYGSDVQPGEGGRRVVSTSFYDRLLAMWTW